MKLVGKVIFMPGKFIEITLPDGSKKKLVSGATVADLAASIGPRLAKDALAGEVDNQLVDLDYKLEKDASVKILTVNDEKGKSVFWHSSAHVLAMAVKELFPKAQLTIGPPIEEGFYYDFYFQDDYRFVPEDLEKIEKKMKEIVAKNHPSARHKWSKEEAIEYYTKKDKNKFKVELAKEMEGTVTYYTTGPFKDLCRGPHIPAIGKIKAIKLLRSSAAYWKGNSDRETLQRIYGITFSEEKQLKESLERIEEAEKRDHRKIGKQLELFEISEEIGPGLVLWLPKGNIIKEELEKWAKETEKSWGYQRVTTPIIAKGSLFSISGHLQNYKDSMFAAMKMDNEEYYIKPMNCPFHHLIFKSKTRSYKELPLRLAEYGWCHRYEDAGAVIGLMRVRGMQMNDAHIYCTKEQAVKEFVDAIKLHEYYYKILGITEYWMELSLRDPANKKYLGTDQMWKDAEELMRKAMELSGVKYKVIVGGAAFYGPKIDFQIKSAIGRTFTASTNQIDLFTPERFGLKYIGADNAEHTPVVIHRAPLGTHERFIGFLIEHFGGRFPLWLSPEQIRVIPVSDKHISYADKMSEMFSKEGFRTTVERSVETVEYKIRESQIQKIPVVLVVGDKEVEKNTVAVRKAKSDKVQFGVNPKNLLEELKTQIAEKK